MEKQFIKMLSTHKEFKEGEEYEIDSETATKWLDAELCETVNKDVLTEEFQKLHDALDERDAKLIETFTKAMRTESKIPAVVKDDSDRSLNDWFRLAVKAKNGRREEYDNKYGSKANVLNSQSGADGGYFIPTEFSEKMAEVSPLENIVRPRADVHNMSGSVLKIPALDQSVNLYGGILTYYTEEVNSGITQTDFKARNLTLEANDLSALIYVTQDQMDDSGTDMGSFISRKFREAILAREDKEYLIGDGVGKPLGVLNSGAAIGVSRTTSSKVKLADVVGMEAKLLPNSRGRAIWVAHISTLPQVVQLVDSAGNLIYVENLRDGGFPTLRGMPIFFVGNTKALGTKGDFMLCDFSSYSVGMRKDVEIKFSEDVRFHQNQIAFKANFRHDGKPSLDSAVKLDDGSTTVSPFVILNA